jgi:tungstate transport system ATP-binding protein
MAPLFELRDITKSYNNSEVLNIPRLVIEQGGIYGIMGPNGAGKSTLLSILAFLIPPTSGVLYCEGTDVTTLNRYELRRKVTLIHQNPYLFDTTVRKNIVYGLKGRRIPKAKRDETVNKCLKQVGMLGFEERRARELSGGETQRVAIARALALGPQILLLDEPTANVDRHGVEQLEIILQGLNKKHDITIIVATHDVNQAYRLSGEVIYLFAGKIAKSPIENLLKGRIAKKDKDLFLFDTGKIQVALLPGRDHINHIAIPPEDIIVSHEPITTSARNSFAGTIFQVTDEGDFVSLTVDIGEKVRARITKRSFKEMNLTLGSSIYLTFKSSSVETF